MTELRHNIDGIHYIKAWIAARGSLIMAQFCNRLRDLSFADHWYTYTLDVESSRPDDCSADSTFRCLIDTSTCGYCFADYMEDFGEGLRLTRVMWGTRECSIRLLLLYRSSYLLHRGYLRVLLVLSWLSVLCLLVQSILVYVNYLSDTIGHPFT